MLNLKRQMNETGDTIIEVLMALTVLSLALGIGYSIANSSVIAVRQAEENNKATKYVQAQIEGLRALASSTTANIYQPLAFCLDTTLAIKPSTDPLCTRDNLYKLSITYTASSPTPGDGIFAVTATWTDIKGSDPATVKMSYRVYP